MTGDWRERPALALLAWENQFARSIHKDRPHQQSSMGFAAECLDLLRLLLVEVSDLISRFAMRPQQFVQLRVYGLSVAVF